MSRSTLDSDALSISSRFIQKRRYVLCCRQGLAGQIKSRVKGKKRKDVFFINASIRDKHNGDLELRFV